MFKHEWLAFFYLYFSSVLVAGFEETVYTVSEGSRSVEVCVAILAPTALQLSNTSFTTLRLSTLSVSATGNDNYIPDNNYDHYYYVHSSFSNNSLIFKTFV